MIQTIIITLINIKKPYKSKQHKYNPKNTTKKWQPRCYRCKRLGHKADVCPLKKKIDEIFHDDENLCNKITDLLLSNKNEDSTSSSPRSRRS